MLPKQMYFLLLLSAYQFCGCMFCIVALENRFEAKPHCKELLALPFKMVSEMSQSLALLWRDNHRVYHSSN